MGYSEEVSTVSLKRKHTIVYYMSWWQRKVTSVIQRLCKQIHDCQCLDMPYGTTKTLQILYRCIREHKLHNTPLQNYNSPEQQQDYQKIKCKLLLLKYFIYNAISRIICCTDYHHYAMLVGICFIKPQQPTPTLNMNMSCDMYIRL